ncbi:hypothetical protein BTN50_1116 [Candidatus Enterovibrio altilux]|uniref:Uncharacterized protein n=1 Tax=Candidatus Enterovibrio altilux TaxID=1927128 RepID=A0A291B9C2_9GAMM|nr:hypothetical protein BTN50_1116 [Candidatus Enterovibrio luxaltus]
MANSDILKIDFIGTPWYENYIVLIRSRYNDVRARNNEYT